MESIDILGLYILVGGAVMLGAHALSGIVRRLKRIECQQHVFDASMNHRLTPDHVRLILDKVGEIVDMGVAVERILNCLERVLQDKKHQPSDS